MDTAKLAIAGFRRERGLLWPDYDKRCAEVTFAETERALPLVLEHVQDRRVVVQAGGNCGPLVIELARQFLDVYTFEPDPQNFVALTVNTAAYRNVHRYQAALGFTRGTRSLAQGDDAHPDNCGALYVAGDGPIPTLAVDDLGLASCDLLMLDIEGSEAKAIRGASSTISACRPVIVIENKGLGERFFQEAGQEAKWRIEGLGYRVARRIKNDLVMVPA